MTAKPINLPNGRYCVLIKLKDGFAISEKGEVVARGRFTSLAPAQMVLELLAKSIS